MPPERERNLSPILHVQSQTQETREGQQPSVSVPLFPGQGKPREIVGVAQGLYRSYKSVRRMYEDASEVLGYSLGELSFSNQDELKYTRFAQAAIFVGSLAAYRVYQHESKRKGSDFNSVPSFLAGHSVGEFTAVVASGALNFLKGVDIIKVRGETMQEACDARETEMYIATRFTGEQLQEFLREFPNIDLCLINADGLFVVGGPAEDFGREDINKWIKDRKVRLRLLEGANGAFHSRYMSSAKDAIEKKIQNTFFTVAKIPLVVVDENGEAKTIQDPEDIKRALIYQTNATFDWRRRANFISEQGATEIVDLADTDLSIMIKNSLGGAYENITTRLGMFIGSRWKPALQVA